MHRPTRPLGELDRTRHLTRPFGELDSWTSPQGLLLCVLIWIPIETLFVLSQSEFPLRFYDKNKLDAQHSARNQASWIPQRLLLCVLFWIPIETLFVSSQSELLLALTSISAFSFESRSIRLLFRLDRSYHWNFTIKTAKICFLILIQIDRINQQRLT